MTMFLRCLLVALVAAAAAARTARTEKTAVQKAFEKYILVPDPVKVAPVYLMTAKHSNGAVPNLGGELQLWQLREKPVVSYPADRRSHYTIVFFDVDYNENSSKDYKQFLHYLMINVPGNQVNKGQVIVDYVRPILRKGSPIHRFVGLVFKQLEKIVEDDWSAINDLERFCISDFVEKYCLGNPVAGNFLTARNKENYCDN